MAMGNFAKKRTAPSQAGPARKKTNLGKSTLFTKRKGADEKSVQRKQPVTATGPSLAGSDTEDESGSDGDFDEDFGDEAPEEFDSDVEIVAFDTAVTGEKEAKNASARESHKAQKVLQQERRAAKQHSALLSDAKRVWSKARQMNIPKQERQKFIAELMGIVRGKVQEVVFKHDASRIIQTIVKHGGQKERDEIAAELKGRYKDLSQNKYSKFLVTKLIRTCPEHRTSILLEFKGHVVRLLLHREATSVIADAYELYANAFERALLLHDFYGKEVILFTPALGKGAAADENEKGELRRGLAGALEGADAEKRKRILGAVRENLDPILNNPEKGTVSHGIFHHVLWEYLSELNGLDDESEKEMLRRNMFEACQEVFAEMVHTKDGSRIVREFIAYGTAKDRKQVIKVLKPHIDRICKDDEAQLVLFTALDMIDDTKMTAKSLVSEIVSRASTLYTSPQGRRSLFYLLVPRSSRHFTPAQNVSLAETDPIKVRTSKKDDTVRREEILIAASEGLIALLEDEKAEEIIRNPGGSLLVGEIMLYSKGNKSKAIESLLKLLEHPYPSSDESKPHVIDIPHSCRVYRTLLLGGHYSQTTKAIVPAPSFSPSAFASAWLKSVAKENTRAMGGGGGAFVVAALCERIHAVGSEAEKKKLGTWLDSSFVKGLKDDVRGKAVLLESLRSSSLV